MEKEKNIIVILGAPRSGTTLLSGLLTGNEECCPNIPECTYITQIIEHYYNIVNYHDKERFKVYAKDNNTLLGVYKKHVDGMLSIVLSNFKSNKEYKNIVLKDPLLTKYIDLVQVFFGKKSKIIFIARDPRAIIASMLKVELKKVSNRPIELTSLIEHITNDIYSYYYLVHKSKMNEKGLLIVKYENIISEEKELELIKIDKYIGYKFDREPFKRNFFNFDKNDPTYSANYEKNIINNKSSNLELLSEKHIENIEYIFSGINKYYKWW